MALSCLLTRISTSQCLTRGQPLRTAKSLLIRSSTTLANRNLPALMKNDNDNKLLVRNWDLKLIPASTFKSTPAVQGLAEPEHKKHSHVLIWQLERMVSVALLPIIPAALIMPSQTLDTIAAILIVMHTHWGLEAIVVDYVRPILFGPVAPKIGLALLYILSIATLAGLLNLIYNDCGLANAVIQICKS